MPRTVTPPGAVTRSGKRGREATSTPKRTGARTAPKRRTATRSDSVTGDTPMGDQEPAHVIQELQSPAGIASNSVTVEEPVVMQSLQSPAASVTPAALLERGPVLSATKEVSSEMYLQVKDLPLVILEHRSQSVLASIRSAILELSEFERLEPTAKASVRAFLNEMVALSKVKQNAVAKGVMDLLPRSEVVLHCKYDGDAASFYTTYECWQRQWKAACSRSARIFEEREESIIAHAPRLPEMVECYDSLGESMQRSLRENYIEYVQDALQDVMILEELNTKIGYSIAAACGGSAKTDLQDVPLDFFEVIKKLRSSASFGDPLLRINEERATLMTYSQTQDDVNLYVTAFNQLVGEFKALVRPYPNEKVPTDAELAHRFVMGLNHGCHYYNLLVDKYRDDLKNGQVKSLRYYQEEAAIAYNRFSAQGGNKLLRAHRESIQKERQTVEQGNHSSAASVFTKVDSKHVYKPRQSVPPATGETLPREKENVNKRKREDTRECFRCGERGHIAKNCTAPCSAVHRSSTAIVKSSDTDKLPWYHLSKAVRASHYDK